MIDVNKMLAKRQDLDEQYTLFFEEFLPAVSGRRKWKKGVQMHTHLASTKVTATDETLGLVILLNSHEHWEAMHQYKEDQKKPGFEMEYDEDDKEIKPFEKIKTKYTSDSKQNRRKSFGGWNDEGKLMFNKLRKEVNQDRQEYIDWDQGFLEKMVAKQEQPKSKKR